MRLAYRIVGGLLVVVISFVITLAVLDFADNGLPRCPTGSTTPLTGPFSKFDATGYAYIAPVPVFDKFADSGDNGNRSRMFICEDGKVLGPAHSPHSDIAKIGRGRFSHWRDIGFIFSTSDNTNPNNSGRRYSAVDPP
jgi:hypothetical protein